MVLHKSAGFVVRPQDIADVKALGEAP